MKINLYYLMSFILEKIQNLFNSNFGEKKYLKNGFIALISLFIINRVIRGLLRSIRARRKRIEAVEVRKIRDAKIENFLLKNLARISNDRIIEIISLDATSLLKSIRKKEVSVVESFLAYCIRAATVGKEYGYITDVDFENGLKIAEEYQILIDANDFEVIDKLPLFGLPISIKDHMKVKGMTCTVGYTSLGRNIVHEDSLIVSILRKKGAIPYVHTNVPQGMLAMDSSNRLWGECKNPWNPVKISGGSSGGEGGLIASRSSPVGIGSDIGGSIRIPSVLNGIYGFKPTSNRISKIGSVGINGSNYTGFLNFHSSWGPMCRSSDDVILMSKNLFGEFHEDCYVNNSPFNEILFNRMKNTNKIRIAYYYGTPNNQCTPAIEQSVKDVATVLEGQGYELVKFPIELFLNFVKTGFKLIFNSDAAIALEKMLDDEPHYNYYEKLFFIYSKPRWLNVLLARILNLVGQKRTCQSLMNSEFLDKSRFLKVSHEFEELKANLIAYLKKEKIEALLSPVLPVPCISLGTAGDYAFYNEFNFICNMADLPACTIPLYLNKNTEFSSKFNSDMFSIIQEKEARESLGVPLGVQIISLPMHDEFVLKLMKEISDHFQFEKKEGTKIVELIQNNKIKK